MARFYKKRRYGKKGYGKKRYGKMGYRKMKRSKAKLYRQGGNFAMVSSRASPELKSLDSMVFNALGSTGAGLWGDTAAGQFGSNLGVANWAANIGTGIAACTNATYNTYNGALLVGNTGGVACQPLNICTTGTSLSQRIGRKIMMKSIKIDLDLRPGVGTGYSVSPLAYTLAGTLNVAACTAIRLMLVYDRQTNGAAVYPADVLASPGGSGVGASSNFVSVTSSNNLNNRSRFLTIYDKTYIVGSADTTTKVVRIYKKLNLPVIYTGAVGPQDAYDCAQIQTGGLFFFAVSDGAPGSGVMTNISAGKPYGIIVSAAAANMPVPHAVCGSFRLRFLDN